MTLLRTLVFPLEEPLNPSTLTLLTDYRLLVNEILREALSSGKTSRNALSRFARDRALHHQITGQHAVVASGIGLSLARGHRRRHRQGIPPRLPYVRSLFLRTNPATFHFNPDSGKVRLSLRNGAWTSFSVHVAPYHRAALQTPGIRVKQLYLRPDSMQLVLERPAPEPYPSTSLLALDTNETSLDGVALTPSGGHLCRVAFPELRAIQHIHFRRRRFLNQKKAHDRRVARRLLSREGRRERHRIRSRLHVLTRRLVETLAAEKSALALEDLTRLPTPRRSHSRFRPSTRRRLSSWPRRELHRQLAYKAAERGVPVYWVDPFRTSQRCPRCGEITKPRSRVAPTFACEACGWKLDRQMNAGLNVGATVLRESAELGGLRLDLDALSEDAMRPRYPFAKAVGHGRSGRRGRDAVGSADERRQSR